MLTVNSFVCGKIKDKHVGKDQSVKKSTDFFADCTAPFEVNFRTDAMADTKSADAANPANAGKNYFSELAKGIKNL